MFFAFQGFNRTSVNIQEKRGAQTQPGYETDQIEVLPIIRIFGNMVIQVTIRRGIKLYSLALLLTIFTSTNAFCELDVIARLSDYSGKVLVKTKGVWAEQPTKNLPLYSRDKVVTRIGQATVTFNDGAVLEIKNNSNLFILEREEEKGVLRKVKAMQRRILLMLGKMFFKTGKAKGETQFNTATAVAGIRGTALILSVAENSTVYIRFTEGREAYFIGDLQDGVADDVPVELADQNPMQRAAYRADAAAVNCNDAKIQAAAGKIAEVQADWVCANAAETAGYEVWRWSTVLVANNPSPDVVEWARNQLSQAQGLIEAAQEAKQKAIEGGAVPEGYQPPEVRKFNVPLQPLSPFDESAASSV